MRIEWDILGHINNIIYYHISKKFKFYTMGKNNVKPVDLKLPIFSKIHLQNVCAYGVCIDTVCHIHIHTYVDIIYIHIFTHIYIHIFMPIDTYVIYVHIHIYIYIYHIIHMYINIYIYIWMCLKIVYP